MNQELQILKFLQNHKRGITQKEAIERFGCYRLSARIADLRESGYNIVTDWETEVNRYGDKVRFGRYRLIPQ